MICKPSVLFQIGHYAPLFLFLVAVVGVCWLMYAATFAAIDVAIGALDDALTSALLALFVDVALFVGGGALFLRWLGTQPNPVDS